MDAIRMLSPAGLVSSPAFSHVAIVPPGATTIYVGGQNAVDATGALVGGDDIAAQVRQVMTNLGLALDAAGATVADLVSVFVLLVQGADITAAYGAAAQTLDTGGDPPLVGAAMVPGLGVAGALVEVSAIAAVLRPAR